MSGFMKLVLILFGLAYLISPVDIIPDLLLPWLGWIDDGMILYSVYHLIRHGDLPWFLFKKKAGARFPGPQPGQPKRPRQNTEGHRRKENRSTEAETDKKKQAGRATKNTGAKRPHPKASPSATSPHEILGVHPNATREEIQKAYKKKIKQYHPDKLSHLGKEFADLANEKFLEIQTAYDQLKGD